MKPLSTSPASALLAHCTHATLADQYFDRLAWKWQTRERALNSHAYDFAALCAMDHELQQTARALRLLQIQPEWLKQRWLDPLRAGEMFALGWHAIATQDQATLRACMGLVQAMPHLRHAFAAAMQWASPLQALAALSFWHKLNQDHLPHDSESQATALADWANTCTLGICQHHPEIWKQLSAAAGWQACLSRPQNTGMHVAVLDCALHVLEWNTAFASAIQAGLQASQATVRQLAAEVLLLRSTPTRRSHLDESARQELIQQALANEPSTAAAMALAALRGKPWDTVLAALGKNPAQQRLYLQALAWSGHKRGIPLLIEHLDHPQHARLAAAALSMITGSRPAYDGWLLATPQPTLQPAPQAPVNSASSAIPLPDADLDLPLPDPTAFKRWWSTHASRFENAPYWLGGLPVTQDHLHHILRSGPLAWRAMAAYHLQALEGGARFPTSSPSAQQLARLQ